MIFTVILAIIGAMVIYRLLVLLFWTALWLFLQPVRLVLALVSVMTPETGASVPPLPDNVIRFPRGQRR
jgi:hypothetical protein